MKAKRSSSAGVVALLLIGAGGVYGVSHYIRQTPEARRVPEAVRRSVARPEENPGSTASAQRESHRPTALVFTPHVERGQLTFTHSGERVPAGTEPIVFAINRTMASIGFLPSGARAVGVDVREGIAYVDFTEQMETTYGSGDEETLLQGLLRAVGQFPNVERVQFMISGKPIETFGNVSLTEPLDVVRPEPSSTTPGA